MPIFQSKPSGFNTGSINLPILPAVLYSNSASEYSARTLSKFSFASSSSAVKTSAFANTSLPNLALASSASASFSSVAIIS